MPLLNCTRVPEPESTLFTLVAVPGMLNASTPLLVTGPVLRP